jgi:hypothetical protein
MPEQERQGNQGSFTKKKDRRMAIETICKVPG